MNTNPTTRQIRKNHSANLQANIREAILQVLETEFHAVKGICSRPFSHASHKAQEKVLNLFQAFPPQQHALVRKAVNDLRSEGRLPWATRVL